MIGLPFTKMHSLGNDFVIFDARSEMLKISESVIRAIADRRSGIGCDQLIVMEKASSNTANLSIRIYNADGIEVDACGNASRCVGQLVVTETGIAGAVIETNAGIIKARLAGTNLVAIDMGPVMVDWQEIPLAKEHDTLHLGIEKGPLVDPVGVSIGNPHAVFFVKDVHSIDLENLGSQLEHHPLFPARTNVEIVQVLSENRLRLRVWERGVGITRACGTGACAALAAAVRRGLMKRVAEVVLDGGSLRIVWRKNNHILMTGPVTISFSGHLHPHFFEEVIS